MQVAQISQGDLNRLWNRAKDAKVGQKLDFGQPNIADAMSTRFKLRTESGLVTTEVYALREVDADPALSADQAANRQRFVSLLDALSDLPKTLGKHAVSPQKAYNASVVAGLARVGGRPERAEPEGGRVARTDAARSADSQWRVRLRDGDRCERAGGRHRGGEGHNGHAVDIRRQGVAGPDPAAAAARGRLRRSHPVTARRLPIKPVGSLIP